MPRSIASCPTTRSRTSRRDPVASVPNVLVVAPSQNIKSVRELIALAKAKPGQINFGSAGLGSGTHINGEQFKLAAASMSRTSRTKGTPEALTDTATGRIHYFFAPLVPALPFIRDKRLVPLAVSTAKRSPVLPDVPTIAEAALPGLNSTCGTVCSRRARLPSPSLSSFPKKSRASSLCLTSGSACSGTGQCRSRARRRNSDAFIKTEVDKLARWSGPPARRSSDQRTERHGGCGGSRGCGTPVNTAG